LAAEEGREEALVEAHEADEQAGHHGRKPEKDRLTSDARTNRAGRLEKEKLMGRRSGKSRGPEHAPR
jgi:hypothetical protein